MKKSIVAVALLLSACGSRSIPQDDSLVAACPACAAPSFSCRGTEPGQEGMAMTISGNDADSCTATLGSAALELRCKDSSVCDGDDCVPFEFDGTTLSFRYGIGPVSCSAGQR